METQTTTIVSAARLELIALERSIVEMDGKIAALREERNAIAQRYVAVKNVLELYKDPQPTLPAPPQTLGQAVPQATGIKRLVFLKKKADGAKEELTSGGFMTLIERSATLKEQALTAAADLLSTGIQLHTTELLEAIEKRGVIFGASDKAAHLSVLLSRDDRFVSDRRNGWSLKDTKEETSSAK